MDLLTPRPQQELVHLLRLAATHPNWREYASWKAQHMANHDPVTFNELPLMLANALAVPVSGKS